MKTTTITIPKDLVSVMDLVAVPRTSYEAFLAWQKKIKSLNTFAPTTAEKKALARGRKNVAQGKYTTLTTIRHALGITH